MPGLDWPKVQLGDHRKDGYEARSKGLSHFRGAPVRPRGRQSACSANRLKSSS